MRIAEKRKQMRALVKQWQQSGKSLREYAKLQGVNYRTLTYWANKYGKQASSRFSSSGLRTA